MKSNFPRLKSAVLLLATVVCANSAQAAGPPIFVQADGWTCDGWGWLLESESQKSLAKGCTSNLGTRLRVEVMDVDPPYVFVCASTTATARVTFLCNYALLKDIVDENNQPPSPEALNRRSRAATMWDVRQLVEPKRGR